MNRYGDVMVLVLFPSPTEAYDGTRPSIDRIPEYYNSAYKLVLPQGCLKQGYHSHRNWIEAGQGEGLFLLFLN